MPVDGEVDFAEYTRVIDAPAPLPPGSVHNFEFRADPKDYFRIWIVNMALTIVTLGIYSAWAKVRKLQYFYGSTSLGGSSFGYHARPLSILKGRVIAVVAAAAYVYSYEISPYAYFAVLGVIGIAAPWLLVKSRLFAMRMTSWRGLRFSFEPDFRGAYKTLGALLLGSVVSAGLLFPLLLRERYRFAVTRSGFGSARFDCSPSILHFYKTTIVAAVVFVGGVFGAVWCSSWIAGLAMRAGVSQTAGLWIGVFVVTTGYLLAYAIAGAYMQARNLNEVLNETALGRLRFRSHLSAGALAGIYVGNAIRIALTLGLYAPWAQVRLMRYRLDSTVVEGPLDEFVAASVPETTSAVGEEVGEFLDIEFGF